MKNKSVQETSRSEEHKFNTDQKLFCFLRKHKPNYNFCMRLARIKHELIHTSAILDLVFTIQIGQQKS